MATTEGACALDTLPAVPVLGRPRGPACQLAGMEETKGSLFLRVECSRWLREGRLQKQPMHGRCTREPVTQPLDVYLLDILRVGPSLYLPWSCFTGC